MTNDWYRIFGLDDKIFPYENIGILLEYFLKDFVFKRKTDDKIEVLYSKKHKTYIINVDNLDFSINYFYKDKGFDINYKRLLSIKRHNKLSGDNKLENTLLVTGDLKVTNSNDKLNYKEILKSKLKYQVVTDYEFDNGYADLASSQFINSNITLASSKFFINTDIDTKYLVPDNVLISKIVDEGMEKYTYTDYEKVQGFDVYNNFVCVDSNVPALRFLLDTHFSNLSDCIDTNKMKQLLNYKKHKIGF